LEGRDNRTIIVKIAYFSPMPPARTGIATYSGHVLKALARRWELAVYSPGPCEWSEPDKPVFDFKTDPFHLKGLPNYDHIVYHLGNNPYFHLDIYNVLLQFPGIVFLHDTVLYFLIAGRGKGGMIKEFCENYGPDRMHELWKVLDDSPNGDILQYRNPAAYPFLRRALNHANAVVVHNHTSAATLKEMGLGSKVHVMPLPYYPDPVNSLTPGESIAVRSQFGISQDEVLIGIFGFVGTTKRINQILQAARVVLDATPNCRFRLFVVGEGESLKGAIRENKLEERVIETGFVPESRFLVYLNAVDVVANLRYPSMGESSATLMQAMSLGKPVIVTNHGAFAELPDDVVSKVSYGSKEITDIACTLRRLIENRFERDQLGALARRYVEEHCSVERVADRLCDLLATLEATRTGRRTRFSSNPRGENLDREAAWKRK